MSQFIKFYFTSSMLDMFRILISIVRSLRLFCCITTLVACSYFLSIITEFTLKVNKFNASPIYKLKIYVISIE